MVKNIQIISDKKFSLANKDEFINKNLLFVDQNQIAEKIIRENTFLKTAIVDKVWPATIKITIYFYELIAALTVNQGFLNLSVDGRILTKTKDNKLSLPVINYYQKLNSGSFQTGDWIDYKDIQQTLFFIDKLGEINLIPLTIDIIGQDMLVFKLDDGKKITFSVKKDREQQSFVLETIVRNFKIQGKEFKGIDLRFNKPVIQF